jgi:hypothetical protein
VVVRRREIVHYTQVTRRLHIQMISSLFRSEYKSRLDDLWNRTQSNTSMIMIDFSSGLCPPGKIRVLPLAQFPALFHGSFDSPEMETRKDGMLKEFSAGPLSATNRLVAFVFFWDTNRRIHILAETARKPRNRDRPSKFSITRSVVSVE